MRSLQKQFVIYIFVFLSVTHKVVTRKINRDLTISVALPSLSHLPNILGGNGGILSTPLDIVKSFIPNSSCGFNCGNDHLQQFNNHPHGHGNGHQNNRGPPSHSNGFHGNPHRQPHPVYGPPFGNNWSQQFNKQGNGNFYDNNRPQQNYQYGQYGPNSNYYQENSFTLPTVSQNVNYGFNTPNFNPSNNLGFIINNQNAATHTGFNNPMTNQPNIIENIPNQSFNSGFNINEENPTQELNTGSIISNNYRPAVQPQIVETTSETSISAPNIIQIIPQQPLAGQPAIMESFKDTEINMPTTEQPPDLIDIYQNIKEKPVYSINPNDDTNDFIYPDSPRYIQKNNVDIDSLNSYPSIDIRRRRSIF